MEFEVLKTSKDEESILFKKCLYYKKKINKDGTKYWQCSERKCSASVTTCELAVIRFNGKKIGQDVDEIVRQSHTIPAETTTAATATAATVTADHRLKDIEIEVLRAKQNLLSLVVTSSAPIEQLYHAEENRLAEQFGAVEIVAEELPGFYSLKSILYRRRNAQYPPQN